MSLKKNINKMPIHRCIKVENIRKHGYKSLKDWINNENNLYIGRAGRIFIDKQIFHYSGSKWKNPYKVGDKHYTLVESLKLYKKHIRESELYNDLEELLQYKELGCFCGEEYPCHAKILIKLLKEKLES